MTAACWPTRSSTALTVEADLDLIDGDRGQVTGPVIIGGSKVAFARAGRGWVGPVRSIACRRRGLLVGRCVPSGPGSSGHRRKGGDCRSEPVGRRGRPQRACGQRGPPAHRSRGSVGCIARPLRRAGDRRRRALVTSQTSGSGVTRPAGRPLQEVRPEGGQVAICDGCLHSAAHGTTQAGPPPGRLGERRDADGNLTAVAHLDDESLFPDSGCSTSVPYGKPCRMASSTTARRGMGYRAAAAPGRSRAE